MPRKNKQQRQAEEARYEAAMKKKALLSSLFEFYDVAIHLGKDICQLTANMDMPDELKEKIGLMGKTVAAVEDMQKELGWADANTGQG
jgi:hypothetical protein